ncbi:MAG: acylneuraminate cytidylyltransferase family protein [Gammaproteobacteria bacterium]|nr:acylneuraminate cytidylyltransferase family protein [Gammaproteobacteria bacterium]
MSFKKKNILAVIPARGGSKGIPRKNLRHIHGKSLISHASDCVNQLNWIDAVILSSDDDEICEHAKELNIDVPFTRPEELSTDDAKSIDVWRHAWLYCEDYYSKSFDISVLLEPTSPMRTPEDITNAVTLLIEQNSFSVASVSKTPGHYTPHKTLQLSDSGFINSYLEGGIKYSIRQQIPDFFHRNGICYATTRNSLIDNYNLMEKQCIPLVIERPVVNIDEEIDLKLAEVLLNELYNKL